MIPGVKKPENSWMNWNAWSAPPSSGFAARIAIRIATVAAMRPMRTSLRSITASIAPLSLVRLA